MSLTLGRVLRQEIVENGQNVTLPQRDAELDQHDGGGLVRPSVGMGGVGGGGGARVVNRRDWTRGDQVYPRAPLHRYRPNMHRPMAVDWRPP